MRTSIGMISIGIALLLGCDSTDDESDGTCTVDNQCKGDRICVEGQCISPDASTSPEGGMHYPMDGEIEAAQCGNDRCDREKDESCATCPEDCGNCRVMNCGDGVCSEETCETCANCTEDCGECTEVKCACGDGVCDTYYCKETCSNCEEDCGSCDDESDGGPGESTSAMPGYFYCGNGVCEPGEDVECEDCASLSNSSTCEKRCVNDCECEQPWTGCGVGISPICSPAACETCYEQNQSCCWCPKESCGSITCVDEGETCPSC